MNNSLLDFILFILVMFVGAIAYRTFLIFKAYIDTKRQRKLYPSVIIANDKDLCKSPHKWDRIKLALGDLPVDTYTVCTECGFISHPGSKHRLNSPGLEVYKNNIKRREERVKRWEHAFMLKQKGSNDIMNTLIKSHVGQLTSDLQNNIEVLQQFFRKANLELDSLYQTLNKKVDEEDNHG